MLYIYGPVLSFALLCPVIWDALAIYGPVLRFVFICGLFGFCGSNYVESDKSPHFFRFCLYMVCLSFALLCIGLYMALAYIWPVLSFALLWHIYIGLFGFVGNSFGGRDKSPHFFRFWPFALFYALLCPLALLYMPVCLHWLCLGGYIALYGLHWLIYGLYIWLALSLLLIL